MVAGADRVNGGGDPVSDRLPAFHVLRPLRLGLRLGGRPAA